MKIALVAMSGIRVCDEELLRMGLTLPGFVERSKTIASLPSLGLLTLAALVPDRHEVHYFEVADTSASELLDGDFDLVAISSFSARILDGYALARELRGAGVRVVMGGPHVTYRSGEALRFCDAVVMGEGEPLWPQLLADAGNGRLRPVYDARRIEYDLADAPCPRFDLLDISKYNRLTVQASRGCPHLCDFCAASPLLTSRYKQKPVAKVLNEIDRICEIWPRPFIEFADDNAFVNRKYWKQFLPALAERQVRWFAETDLSVSKDEELLVMMRESGCAQVLIGFESPTPAGLAGVEMKRDWKRKNQERYRAVVDRIQSKGITVNGCFVIGLDGHTSDIFEDVYAFADATCLYDVQITVMTAFPGTPLYARLLREGRLLEPENWYKCTLFDINYRPDPLSVEELSAGFRKLAWDLYTEEFTRKRRNGFRRRLRKAIRNRDGNGVPAQGMKEGTE